MESIDILSERITNYTLGWILRIFEFMDRHVIHPFYEFLGVGGGIGETATKLVLRIFTLIGIVGFFVTGKPIFLLAGPATALSVMTVSLIAILFVEWFFLMVKIPAYLLGSALEVLFFGTSFYGERFVERTPKPKKRKRA